MVLGVVIAMGGARADTPAGKAAGGPPKPVAAQPKNVKQASRAELEAEVEQLRSENAKLKAENDSLKAKEADRQKRLEKAVGTPASTLK